MLELASNGLVPGRDGEGSNGEQGLRRTRRPIGDSRNLAIRKLATASGLPAERLEGLVACPDF